MGEENTIQIVMDNETTFKATWELLMQKKKHLYWTPNVAHCINLMLEDIGKLKNVKEIIDKGKKIFSLIYHSAQTVNHMRENCIKGHDLF